MKKPWLQTKAQKDFDCCGPIQTRVLPSRLDAKVFKYLNISK